MWERVQAIPLQNLKSYLLAVGPLFYSISSGLTGSFSGTMDFWSLSRDSALRMSIFHREKMPLVTITPFNYLVFSRGGGVSVWMLCWLCATGTWEYHTNFRWVLQSFIINLTTLTNKDILTYQIHLTGPKRNDVCLLQLKNTNQFLRFLSGQDLDLEHFLSWQSLP